MKKLFFTLCALCLCGTMWAQDSVYGLYYTVEDGVATIVAPEDGTVYSNENLASYEGVENGITIPAEVDGNPVVAIGASAFNGSTISGHLVIPASLLYLNTFSFGYCTGITAVTFEYSETALIDNNSATYSSSFYGCSGITIVYQYRNISVPTSGAVASFSYVNKIETVYIGENVTEIAHHLYRSNNGSSDPGFSLKYVVSDAPNPPALGTSAFDNHNTSTFVFYTKAEYLNAYRLDDTWLSTFGGDYMHAYDSDTDPDWPEDVNAFQDENGLWYDPIEDTDFECVLIADQGGEVYSGEITIPETVVNSNDGETYTVTRIDSYAFANSSIEGHVIIPANILNMGISAFENCTGIKEVTYEYSPTALHEENNQNSSGAGASFGGCTGILTVNHYRDIVWDTINNQDGPFVGQTSIQTINIGPRVTIIYGYMYRQRNTSTVTTINCYAVNPPELGSYPFDNLPTEYVINVPQGTLNTYLTATASSNRTAWSYYGEANFSEMSNAFAITTHENNDDTAYATFYNGNDNVELFNGELTAYEATTLEDEGLVIDIVEIGNVIPKATGVVVETPTAGTYLAIATTEEGGSASEDNHLYGFDTATQCSQGESYLYYLLSSYDGVVGFYWGAENGGAFQCQAHRAYLALPSTAVTNATHISIRKGSGEDTTGISSVESAVEGASVKGIYTIQGVRVSNMNQPGLYIVDGKKVLVK